MLVLSRKKNQSIRIGNDVSVTIVEIRNDRVRLGIENSTSIPVLREEVWMAIRPDGGLDCPAGAFLAMKRPQNDGTPAVRPTLGETASDAA